MWPPTGRLRWNIVYSYLSVHRLDKVWRICCFCILVGGETDCVISVIKLHSQEQFREREREKQTRLPSCMRLVISISCRSGQRRQGSQVRIVHCKLSHGSGNKASRWFSITNCKAGGRDGQRLITIVIRQGNGQWTLLGQVSIQEQDGS